MTEKRQKRRKGTRERVSASLYPQDLTRHEMTDSTNVSAVVVNDLDVRALTCMSSTRDISCAEDWNIEKPNPSTICWCEPITNYLRSRRIPAHTSAFVSFHNSFASVVPTRTNKHNNRHQATNSVQASGAKTDRTRYVCSGKATQKSRSQLAPEPQYNTSARFHVCLCFGVVACANGRETKKQKSMRRDKRGRGVC